MSPLAYWLNRRQRQRELTAAAMAEHVEAVTDATPRRFAELQIKMGMTGALRAGEESAE